mgnify:CR=1 FL=1
MAQKIIQVGGSAGVTIPSPQMKELGLSIGDEVKVTIEPVASISTDDKKVAELTSNFVKTYKKDLLNLADR